MPVSASCPVYRNVNDEESLPLLSVSKGCTSVCVSLEWRSHEPETKRRVPVMNEKFPVIVSNELSKKKTTFKVMHVWLDDVPVGVADNCPALINRCTILRGRGGVVGRGGGHVATFIHDELCYKLAVRLILPWHLLVLNFVASISLW